MKAFSECFKAMKFSIFEFNWKNYAMAHHPPYSLDLAPRDYFIFTRPKNWLAGKIFKWNEKFKIVTKI